MSKAPTYRQGISRACALSSVQVKSGFLTLGVLLDDDGTLCESLNTYKEFAVTGHGLWSGLYYMRGTG